MAPEALMSQTVPTIKGKPMGETDITRGLPADLASVCARSRQTPRFCSLKFPRVFGFAALLRS